MILSKILGLWLAVVFMSMVQAIKEPKGKKASSIYEVSLLNRYYKHYCGGAIIRNNWIVTAGRCSLVCGDDLMCAVRYGSADINAGRYAPIRIFVVHPDSNIALAEAPLIIQGRVKPILIHTYPLPSKAALAAVGWRFERSPRACYKKLKRVKFRRLDCPEEEHICATAADRKVCFGDYGGPLVYQNKLIGVSNFGSIDVGENVTESDGEEDFNSTYAAAYLLKRSSPGYQSRKVGPPKPQQGCYSGHGIFVYVPYFVSWIATSIEEQTELYDLDNVPPPEEWNNDYIKRYYNFDKTLSGC